MLKRIHGLILIFPLAASIGHIHAQPAASIKPDALLAVDLNRIAVVERIVEQWRGELGGMPAESFRSKLMALRADQLMSANLSGSFDNVLEQLNAASRSAVVSASAPEAARAGVVDSEGLERLMQRTALTEHQRKAIGDIDKDLVYTPIAPCNLMDTRPGVSPVPPEGGPSLLPGYAVRAVQVSGRCAIPTGAKAVAALYTIENIPSTGGVVFAGDAGGAGGVVVSWSAPSQYATGAGITPLSTAGAMQLQSVRDTHIKVDVTGYFMPPTQAGNGLRIVQTFGVPNTINGSANNSAGGTSQGATISGGGSAGSNCRNNTATNNRNCANEANGNFNTVAGGRANSASSEYSTIAGGESNTASGLNSFVGGGYSNLASGIWSAVAGGAGNQALGEQSFVGGGVNNRAEGHGSTVAGGQGNKAGNTHTTLAPFLFNTVSGGSSNVACTNHATVGGGVSNSACGKYATIAGGWGNFALETSSIGGGRDNVADNFYATVAGGFQNSSYNYAAVAGGASNLARGEYSAIGGGSSNSASGYGSMVPGGRGNVAGGRWSLAAGLFAKVRSAADVGGTNTTGDEGTFVWADAQGPDFVSSGPNQFNIRAIGGVRLNKDTSMFFGKQYRQFLNIWNEEFGIGVQDSTLYNRSPDKFAWYQAGVHNDAALDAGGGTPLMVLRGAPDGSTVAKGAAYAETFNSTSDQNAKQDFSNIDARSVLRKLVAMPISQWSYKSNPSARHIGPTAQDFAKAFGLGAGDKHIATVDADGVALAAIKGLNDKLVTESKRKDAKIVALEKANAVIQKTNAAMQRELAAIKKKLGL